MSANIAEYQGIKGSMRVESLPDGRHRVSVEPASGFSVPRKSWVTAYPLPLILKIHAAKDVTICDEIMREEDPRYVEHSMRSQVLTYLDPQVFAGKRVLDFGCGSGASTLVLSRVLPPCEIVGIELEERLLNVARLRAEHFGLSSLRLLKSPSGDSLPPELGQFDFIMFNAVFEHLLPHERPKLSATGLAAPAARRRVVPEPDAVSIFAGRSAHHGWHAVHQLSAGLRHAVGRTKILQARAAQ